MHANDPILMIVDRGSSLLSMKLSGKDLLVLSIKSLDDAIDFANRYVHAPVGNSGFTHGPLTLQGTEIY